MGKKNLDMHFRAAYGYGDFASNLGYIYGASLRYNRNINASFYWKTDRNHREHKDEPESIIDRFEYVANDLKPLPNVKYNIIENYKTDFRYINNLEYRDPIHSLWYTKRKTSQENFILLWRTKYNTWFPGTHKDPIHDKWDNLIDYLKSDGFEVIEVTYRTPIDEVIDLISRCYMGIGYDGMIHQLFKHYWKPILVFCERYYLNHYMVPQAALEQDYDTFLVNGLEYYYKLSKRRIARYKKYHKEWLEESLVPEEHFLYNIKVNKGGLLPFMPKSVAKIK